MVRINRPLKVLVALTLVLAVIPATTVWAAAPPVPSFGTAVVDGNPGEWDLTNDFFANMHLAGNPNNAVLAKLYLRYDCQTSTLYALVLAVNGHLLDADTDPDNHFIKLGNSTKLVDGNDGNNGTPPDFAFIGLSGNTAQGWEASAILAPGTYTNLNVHAQVDNEQTSAVANRAIPLTLICWDYGDLPANYPVTTNANDGARHSIGNLYLGAKIDGETDGQPHASALGDDLNNHDDEDGVVPTLGYPWTNGVNGGSVDVWVTGGSGCLSGWMDWNGDGDFDDPGEFIIQNVFVTAGQNQVTFDIPDGVVLTGNFFARFRLYAPVDGACAGVTPSVTGAATNGEVEDYVFDPGTPTAITVTSLTARAGAGPLPLALAAGGLLILAAVAFTFRRSR